MKIFLILSAGIAIGCVSSLFFGAFNEERIFIKVRDNSKCSLEKINFVFPEKTVSYSNEQLTWLSQSTEYVIEIFVAPNKENKVEYYIEAEYQNCTTLKGEKNLVKKGDILYETIESGKISHALRN